MANLAIFSPFAKINFNPPFSLTVCMLNDMCLPIHQIKIRQPQKISNLPNFDPSKYTRYIWYYKSGYINCLGGGLSKISYYLVSGAEDSV